MSLKKIGHILEWMWFVALCLTPIVLWILPADYFDESGLILCPSKLFFDFECWGCGMTRAVMHFHHFEFTEALFYNYGIVWAYPALVLIWGIWLRDSSRKLGINIPFLGKNKEQ